MAKPVYVIGHKNPDSDSICSAIAYAYLKNQLSEVEHIPARAGKIHQETKFVLDYFGLNEPIELKDVKARVGDMINGEAPVAVTPNTSIRELGILSRTHDVKTVSIVDKENRLLGLVTLGDIAHKFMQELGLESLGEMEITVGSILRTLSGQQMVEQDESIRLKGNVLIGAMDVDSMKGYIKKGDVVILGNRESAQQTALDLGAACLIITGAHTIKDEVRQKARQMGATVISVPYDTFATARLINMCAPVENIMQTKGIIAFNKDDLVDDAKRVMLETRFRNYPVVDDEGKLLGAISRYHLLALMSKKVILVDHNEKGQAVDGLEQAEILEIIDHHRLADVQTGEPIYFRNEPVGCTATIVAGMYFENLVEIPREMAGIMLAAILSDTVIFKSPTCTPRDKQMAEKLAQIAGVSIEEFGQEMYKAGTSLVGRTTEEIIYQDFKEFKLGELTFGIGQVETMNSADIAEIKDKLVADMTQIKKNKGFDQVLLMVTDILKEGTELIAVGENLEIVERVFGAPIENNEVYLPGVMSRKKQVVPPLSKYLSGK